MHACTGIIWQLPKLCLKLLCKIFMKFSASSLKTFMPVNLFSVFQKQQVQSKIKHDQSCLQDKYILLVLVSSIFLLNLHNNFSDSQITDIKMTATGLQSRKSLFGWFGFFRLVFIYVRFYPLPNLLPLED